MNSLDQAADVIRADLARCTEALRGPISELLADVPPLVVAAVLVEVILEIAHDNPPAAPEIVAGAIEALRTLAAN